MSNIKKVFTHTPVYFAVLAAVTCFFPAGTAGAKPSFNAAFLTDDLSDADVSDLSRFESGGYQPPGNYLVELSVNNDFVSSSEITFTELKNKEGEPYLFPCFSAETIMGFGVNIARPEELTEQDKQCFPFTEKIPGSEYHFDFQKQRLMLSFPQASLSGQARGYIPPDRWESGIPALFMNYFASGNNNSDNTSSYYVNLNSGFNLGAWQFRQSSSWNYNKSKNTSNSRWRSLMNYVQRPIIALKSQLVIGDGNSDGSVFDSAGFRGVRLFSVDNMYPDSQQGYAPTVRGMAKTDAKVVIRQNGYVIYQVYVPPGPFVINDLNPATSSGDLQVTVEEKDGTQQQYIVPYSTLPVLQREGRVKYDVMAGEFRSGNSNQDKPKFVQATLLAGLTRDISVYTGTQLADKYKSVLVGVGQNIGRFGAFSFDVTHANSELADGSNHSGQSFRFLYAKSLNTTGTTFQLLGYRYSTKGFYTLNDVAYKQMSGYEFAPDGEDGDDGKPIIINYHNLLYNKKGRFQVNISQSFDQYGSLYISGNQQSYWNRSGKDEWYQAGYSNSWNGINYSVSLSTTKALEIKERDNMLSVNVSVPFSSFSSRNARSNDAFNNAYATFSATNNSGGREAYRVGVNGTLLEDRNLSYSVSQGHVSQQGYNGSAGLDYQGTYGDFGISYNYDPDQNQLNYRASGAVLLHENGLTFGQSINDTTVLVKAPGAAGVAVENYTGVKTDWRGYAIIPYASAYRNNRIALNPDSFNDNTEIKNNVQNVVPISGAVARATFDTSIGIRALLSLTHNGKPIRFGSMVQETGSQISSIADDDGRVYLTGLPLTGKLLVQWGNQPGDQCTADYDFTRQEIKGPLLRTALECK